MLKKITLISLMCFSLSSFSQKTIKKPHDNGIISFVKKYKSLLPSIFIGATTGFLCKKIDDIFDAHPIALIISWNAESRIRDAIITDLNSHLEQNKSTPTSKKLNHTIAYIASWLSYCHKYLVHY